MAKKIQSIVSGPKNYAIAHAFKGVTFVIEWSDGHDMTKLPAIRALKTEAKKQEFLFELHEGDCVYLENGGPNDRIALFALSRKALVLAIPTFFLGNKETVSGYLSKCVEWSVSEEVASDEESSNEITVRKMRALAIMLTAVLEPEKFRLLENDDHAVLRLKHSWRSYQVSQKILLGNYLRFLGSLNDLYLLESASIDQRIKPGQIATASIVRTIDAILVTVPAEQRAAFDARIGLSEVIRKPSISRKVAEALFQKVAHEFIDRDEDAHGPFLSHMRATKRTIEKGLKPNPVYKRVFEEIPGCGPLISVRVLTAIVDIRRFRTDAALKAYAGYHHFPDGTRARRVKGKACNRNNDLRQAVWQWTQQTIKLKSSPWRQKLDQRRAFELYKLLRDRQLEAMELNLDVEILPQAFVERTIRGFGDMTTVDLGVLNTHVDALREKAGVKTDFSESEDEEDDVSTEGEEVHEPQVDKRLAKLVRGLKKSALDKACRWLGQKFLEHVFVEWRKAIGVHDLGHAETSVAAE